MMAEASEPMTAPEGPVYETTTTTTATFGQGRERLRCHPEYIRTPPGILKITEAVLSITTFICASIVGWGGAQGWVRFVAMTAFITTLVYFILHLINVMGRYRGPWSFVEFIYYCVFTLFYIIAGIVAAAFASRHGSIAATAVFAFAATIAYGVDAFLQYRVWKQGKMDMPDIFRTRSSSNENDRF